MNKHLLTLLAVTMLSTGALGQTMRGPVAPQTVAAWAQALGGYLNSPAPDLSSLSGMLTQLRALDMTDPAIRASVAPITQLVQNAVPAVVLKGEMAVRQAAQESKRPAGPDMEKAWLLGTVLQAHLNDGQRERTQTIAKAIQQDKAAEILAKMELSAGAWEGSKEAGGNAPFRIGLAPAPGSGNLGMRLKPWTKMRSHEAEFIARHGAAILAVPGVEDVKADWSHDWGGKSRFVRVDVSPAADMAEVARGLSPYLYAGVKIVVESRGWTVFDLSTEKHVAGLDPRMALSLKNIGRGTRAHRFIELHGADVRRTPGVIAADVIAVPEYAGPDYVVRVQVEPTAKLAEIKAALTPYHYAGVKILVQSRGWDIYEISDYGTARDLKPLDPRMAASMQAIQPAAPAPPAEQSSARIAAQRVIELSVSALAAFGMGMFASPLMAALAGFALAFNVSLAGQSALKRAALDQPLYEEAASFLAVMAALVGIKMAFGYAVAAGLGLYFVVPFVVGAALATVDVWLLRGGE